MVSTSNLVCATFAALSGYAVTSLAQEPTPLEYGEIQELSAPIEFKAATGAKNELFKRSFNIPGVDEIAIHFNEIDVPASENFIIEIKALNGLDSNKDYVTLQSRKGSDFKKGDEWWSMPFPAVNSAIRVSMLNGEALTGKASFVIDKYAKKVVNAVELESILDPENNNIEFTYQYDHLPDFIDAANPVARMSFFKEDEWLVCTGILVGSNLMLTNQHCINSQKTCEHATVIFDYEWRNTDGSWWEHIGDEYACVELIASRIDADWSIIRLEMTLDESRQYKKPVFTWRDPIKGEALTLIQHAGGEPKSTAKNNCSVIVESANGRSATRKTDFGHRCDTMKGSSGSPIYDESYQVVGLHHWGFESGNPDWADKNRAIKTTELCAPENVALELSGWPKCRNDIANVETLGYDDLGSFKAALSVKSQR